MIGNKYTNLLGAIIGLAIFSSAGIAVAADHATLVLNFVATGDHSPYYYAKKLGWYQAAGIDLSIEQGKGSGYAAQRVGAGADALGVADLGTAMVAKGKGADLVAVMAIYANSPYGMYWLKSSGIKGPKDFAGKKIGVPPGDAGRVMWPAFARAAGVDAASVTWVNVAPLAKLQALKAGSIDVTQSFYSGHHLFSTALGADMGYLAWKDIGINPYSNALIVNGAFLKAHHDQMAGFVKATQKAFAACWNNPDPCLNALVESNSGLTLENERQTWKLTKQLMDDADFRKIGLGWFDEARLVSDYKLIDESFKIDQPFELKGFYTNALLDRSIKAPN